MKKTFLAGFMAFCVCAMSLCTVSCTKEIKQDIADLKGQVADLAQKIAALESKLTSEVNTLNAAIASAKSELEAKIAVTGVEEKNGNVVLTLSNGEKVTVATDNANNANLITTVTENGKTYWAVVGADGKAKSLGVEVGHPDVKLAFKVNPETKELLISYNGTDYEGTGVQVVNPDANNHFVSNPVVGDDYVQFNIGTAQFRLPMYVEDNSTLAAGNDNFFLMFGATKEVALVADGIAEYYVMAKPDGWKATIEESTLIVTAPAAKTAELGAAEINGEILIHATTEAGKCKVAKITVSTGDGLTLEVLNDGTINITNAYAREEVDMWGEPMGFNFTNFFIGFADPETFHENPEAYFESYATNYEFPDPYAMFYNNWNMEFRLYEPGVYEIDQLTANVTELYEWCAYRELEYGSKVVVWVAPVDEKGNPIVEAAKYVDFSYIYVNAELVSATHNEINIKVNAVGADSYIIGYVAESDYGYSGFESYMRNGLWEYFSYSTEYLGTIVEDDLVDAAIKVSDFGMYGPDPLNYGDTYKVWVMPMFDNMTVADYDFDANFLPYVFEFSTNDLVAGGDAAVEFEADELGYWNLSVNVLPSENAEKVYYEWYSVEEYAELQEDEAALIETLREYGYTFDAEGGVATMYSAAPGNSYVLVALTVGTDGKYGEVQAETFSTPALPYNENIAVSIESLTLVDDTYTAVLNVTGADKVVLYYSTSAQYSTFEKYLIQYGVATNNSAYIWGDVVDGKATVTFAKKTSSWYTYDYLLFSAYNVAEDKVSGFAPYKAATIADYVK
jgi:hypothetical protein